MIVSKVFPSGWTDQSFNGSIDKDLIKHVVMLRKLLNKTEQMCWIIDHIKVDKHWMTRHSHGQYE